MSGTSLPLRVSIIVPVLNERDQIEESLASVQLAASRAPFGIELIVVDGGSDDGTKAWLGSRGGITFIGSRPGRAQQMNAGAQAASAAWLLFLHGDTHLSPDHFVHSAPHFGGEAECAFAFELGYRNSAPAYRRMERGIAWRNRTFGLPYGDQAFCIPRCWFGAMGGFRGAPHLEDVDMALRLRSLGRRMRMVGPPVMTSARQYEHQGVVPGIASNLGRLAVALSLYVLRGDHFEWRRFADQFPSIEKAS